MKLCEVICCLKGSDPFNSFEKIHRLARTFASFIPAGVELLNSVITPPMERRKTEWMVIVSEKINELYEKNLVTEDDLLNNDKFFDVFVHASQIAIKNHDEEKLRALKNAVINSALPDTPDIVTLQLFLNLIDSMTSWHISLLRLFKDPQDWANEGRLNISNLSVPSLSSLIEGAFPEFRGKKELYKVVLRELTLTGLFPAHDVDQSMSPHNMMSKRTTSLGDKFIDFISQSNI